MCEKAKRVFIFNQAYGPLLREFTDALVQAGCRCTVFMGVDAVRNAGFRPEVIVRPAPQLNRATIGTRLFSWLAYSLAAVLQLLRCDAGVRVVLFSNPPILPLAGWLCS